MARDETRAAEAGQGLTRLQLWVMAVASAMAVADLYYNQPLLADIGRSFHVSVREVGAIPMLTQVGCALGLFLFVPLGGWRAVCGVGAGLVALALAVFLRPGRRARA